MHPESVRLLGCVPFLQYNFVLKDFYAEREGITKKKVFE